MVPLFVLTWCLTEISGDPESLLGTPVLSDQGSTLIASFSLVVVQSFSRVCDPRDCSTPGFPVLHHLPELAQTHVH